jgi:hypothetical protein
VRITSEIRPSGLKVTVEELPLSREGRPTTKRFSTVVGKH